MKDTLITFETAKLAKEKGFNLDTMQYYLKDGDIWSTGYLQSNSEHNSQSSAPTQSLLQKWLREVHKLDVFCDCIGSGSYYSVIYNNHIKEGNDKVFEQENTASYEDALEIGLLSALKLIGDELD